MFGGAVARIIDTIAVVGLGKVGELVGTLLHAAGFDVTGIDLLMPEDVPFKVAPVDASDPAALGAALDRVDAVISCLPFHLNRVVAEAAAASSLHYFDLTEDVPTTARVRELAAGEIGRASCRERV